MSSTPSPNALSLRELERRGYTATVAEGRIPGTRFSRDLFGFIDVLGLRGDEVLAVQATDATNVSHRIRKIADSPNVGAVREAGWRIVVHGWKGRELVREVDVS